MAQNQFARVKFLASPSEEAEAARRLLAARYGDHALESADAVVALGGDGLMLQTLHDLLGKDIPIYGMNRGSVGFLMNEFREEDLIERLHAAQATSIHPLLIKAWDRNGLVHEAYAINEVSMLRQTYQAAKLGIAVDNITRLDELIADGLLVATPAGSTAYNLSANGPILPLETRLMALTPISAFRPRRWRGALLSDRARVRIDVLEAQKRPVSAVADHVEFRDVLKVEIAMDRNLGVQLLHDPGHSMEERILNEQFVNA